MCAIKLLKMEGKKQQSVYFELLSTINGVLLLATPIEHTYS